MVPTLFLLASCHAPDASGGDDDTGAGRDSTGDDSAPADDSALPYDSEDSGGDDPFHGMGWVCTVDRVRLDAIGLVGLWGDPGHADAIAADGNGAVFGWSGSTWDYVGGLDRGAIAIDGGDDGSVWVIGYREAFVRESSVWSRRELQDISGASPVAVNVNGFDDVTILETGTDPGCSDCTDARNYVMHFDGSTWSVGEDPDYGQPAASGLVALSDGRLLVVGSQGYVRLVEHGAWTSFDLGTSTSLRAVTELADHSILIAANGGVLFAGTIELGFERIRTDWEGDLFAVSSDGTGGAWILGEGETWDGTHLLHWDGKTLVPLGSPGPWSALGTGPDGALRVAGGTRGGVIAATSGGDLAIEWALDGIAPVADIALGEDGVAFSAADGYRNGVIGLYDGEWHAVDLGDVRAITQVETLPDGAALFVTDDANAWRWDGTAAYEEELPIPGIGHYVSAFAVGSGIAAATGTWYDQGENRDAMLEVRDATGTWSDVDLAMLPGDWMFALAIDEAGTVWLSGYDGGYAYLASWTPESGAEVVVPNLESGAFGLWPKAGGGLWVLLQGDTDDGFYAFDGRSFTLELTGVELGGVRDVVEHPTLGTLAAITYDEGTNDPGPAIAVRAKDGTWSPVALVDDEIESLAVLPDESILAGTWQGALRLSDCAWH
jgi:hypothetical protein